MLSKINHNLFITQMTGDWLVQNTKYSLLKKRELTHTYVNQIKWTSIHDQNKYLSLALASINDYNTLPHLKLYCMQLSSSNFCENSYNILALNSKSGQAHVLKYNHKFKFINRFKVIHYSENYLLMIANVKEFTITEKIHFLHNNLKITKSIIRKNHRCIGNSFSSEIRIS